MLSLSVSNAWFFEIIIWWWWGGWSIPYCTGNDCWLEEWVKAVEWVDGVVTNMSASQYIQVVVKYILRFLMLISTLIIIYAWFVLMLWLWDEEKAKKTKMIMIYAVVWLVIIYLAWPLTDFVFNILNAT